MARVFVSYRRADGPYGVGWAAERLESLDAVTGVQTAFHDVELRAGDDFPDALDAEIESSDLLLAVIGPNWLGASGSGPARVQDPDDWVVREIATAFRRGTRVMPVLMAGAQHPLASQLHPSIAELARLHAIPFNDARDLEVVVGHVRLHLSEIDQDRARRAGLEEPIEVPTLPHLRAVVVAAVVAGLVGVLLAIAALGPPDYVPDKLSICPDAACTVTEADAAKWVVGLLILLGAFLGATAVVGAALAKRLFETSHVRWTPIAATAGLALGVVAVGLVGLGGGQLWPEPSIAAAAPRVWSTFAVVAILSLPWVTVMNGAAVAQPRAASHHLAERVRFLGIAADAERWGALFLAVVVMLAVGLVAAYTHLIEEVTGIDAYQPVPRVTFALLISALLVWSHMWSLAKLREFRLALKRDLAVLPTSYRDNAEPRMMAKKLDASGWRLSVVLALPAVTAIAIAIAS